MDGATSLLTETRVSFGVVQAKFSVTKEVELVDGKTKFPRDVGPMDGGFCVLWGFSSFLLSGVRHGVVFKPLREWEHL